MNYQWPSKNQWRQFFKVLSSKEKFSFSIFLFLFAVSFLSFLINVYFKNTEIKPDEGGVYTEGMIGSPRYLQPLYAPANDTDRDLVELLFSGLVKQDISGKTVTDLAKEYKILEDGKVWEFYLKENIFWSDEKPLTADDVIFTIKSIQNPDIKSPLRSTWLGVEIEKISDLGVRFKLKNPSAVFLENCRVKIMPEHIWSNIAPQNFPLTSWNLNPIGSGPYKLKTLSQDKDSRIIALDLVRNPKYFGSTPNLRQISFRFFENESQLSKAYLRGEVQGFSLTSLTDIPAENNTFNLYSFSLPRYFAVFLNSGKSKILADESVRKALNYGTDKKGIISSFDSKTVTEKISLAEIVESPILPEIYGFKEPVKTYQFNLEEAHLLLEKAGFTKTENGFREKIIKKTPSFQLKSNLRVSSQGQEVTELQKCLSKDSEIYPDGEITGVFGQKTKDAVIRFQEKYRDEILKPQNLEKGTGEVLKATRTKLNEICFGESEEIIPLKLSLATVNQPALLEVASLLKSQWELLGIEVEIKDFDKRPCKDLHVDNTQEIGYFHILKIERAGKDRYRIIFTVNE